MMRFRLAWPIGLLAAAVIATAVQAQEPDDLVKAAKAEGSLTFYASIEEGQVKLLLDLFERRYGIKGTYLRLVSGLLVQRFITENDAHENIADVFLDSSPLAFRNHSQYFVPLSADVLPNFAKWPKKWITPYSVTATTSPMVVTYNTEQVTAAEVPANWRAMTDAKWKGKILLTDPRTSETYLGWLGAMERIVGVDFVKALASQDFTIIASGASGAQMVAAGAFPLNLPTYASFAIGLKEKKAPIESLIVRDPEIVSQNSLGLVAQAKHPNAARLFADFIISQDGLRAACKAYPISTPGDPDGKLGCIALKNPELVDYNVSEERKLYLIQQIGLSSR